MANPIGDSLHLPPGIKVAAGQLDTSLPQTPGDRAGRTGRKDAQGGAVAHIVRLGVDPPTQQPLPDPVRLLGPGPDIEKRGPGSRRFFLEPEVGTVFQPPAEIARVIGLSFQPAGKTGKLPQTHGSLERGDPSRPGFVVNCGCSVTRKTITDYR